MDITSKFKNTTDHDIVVEFAIERIEKPKGTRPRPPFPAYSLTFDVDQTVDSGDTLKPNPAYDGTQEWLQQFPIYTAEEPRVSVSFAWHYKDDDVQEECVTVPQRTAVVGKRPFALFGVPWILSARFTSTGLSAVAKSCAGADADEVFDATQFVVEQDGQDDVAATGSRLKVPVAAGKCRTVRMLFAGVTSDRATIVYPAEDDDVPFRWTLDKVR